MVHIGNNELIVIGGTRFIRQKDHYSSSQNETQDDYNSPLLPKRGELEPENFPRFRKR